jgi:hypothetical protein
MMVGGVMALYQFFNQIKIKLAYFSSILTPSVKQLLQFIHGPLELVEIIGICQDGRVNRITVIRFL